MVRTGGKSCQSHPKKSPATHFISGNITSGAKIRCKRILFAWVSSISVLGTMLFTSQFNTTSILSTTNNHRSNIPRRNTSTSHPSPYQVNLSLRCKFITQSRLSLSASRKTPNSRLHNSLLRNSNSLHRSPSSTPSSPMDLVTQMMATPLCLLVYRNLMIGGRRKRAGRCANS